MILVKIRGNSIDIKGHADFAPLGKDIVCSAVSALALTAAECMLRQEAKGEIDVIRCDIKSGEISLKWRGEADFLKTLAVGFELIEKKYGEYVKAV